MCFSASASFAASGILAIVGVASLYQANRKQRLIAAIPLLFALQQVFEGFQWLAIDSGSVNTFAAYGFVIFALIIWPVYIPITVFLMDEKKRNVLKWPIALGICLAIYYIALLILGPIEVEMMQNSIYYHVHLLFGVVTGFLYFLAVCGSLLLSSHREFRIFGVVVFISVAIAAAFFVGAFASVWCFFAALLSSLIYLYIRRNRITVS